MGRKDHGTYRLRTFAEIRRRAVEHIASKGEVFEKRTTVVPSRPRAHTRVQPVRVNETTTGRKRGDAPMKPKNPNPGVQQEGIAQSERGRGRARYNFVVELKDLIAVPNIADG